MSTQLGTAAAAGGPPRPRRELTGDALWAAVAARRVPRPHRVSLPFGWENAGRRSGTGGTEIPAVLIGVCTLDGPR